MSTFERWNEAEPIILHALDLDTKDRDAFVADTCGEDSGLRSLVERLLNLSPEILSIWDNLQVDPDSQTFLEPGTELGHYTIIERLPKGGMGTVYLAKDNNHPRRAAIKVLPQYLADEHQPEYQKLAKLGHPNIAHLYDSGITPQGATYFVMEYVEDGIPITSYCEQKNLPPSVRLQLFKDVCKAVEFAHSAGIVHCDLKPENILVNKDGTVKLLDFGIAVGVGDSLSVADDVKRGITLAYASPEQIVGRNIRNLSDMYSLGVVLCRLIAGRLPYRETELPKLLEERLSEEPLKPSQVATSDAAKFFSARFPRGEFDAIVLCCLREEPDQRYPTPKDLAAAIDAFLNHYPVKEYSYSVPYRTTKALRRHWRGAIAALIVLPILAYLGLHWLSERTKAASEAARAELIDSFMIRTMMLYNPANINQYQEVLRSTEETILNSLHEPSTQIDLLNSLGILYQNGSFYKEAASCHEKALEIAKKRLGPKSLEVAVSLAYLATVARLQGDNKKSENFLIRAIEILKPQVEYNDFSLTHVFFDLAEILSAEGRASEAEALHRKTLLLRVAMPPDENGDRAESVAQSLFGLASIWEKQSKNLGRAEVLTKICLAYRQRIYPPGEPRIANALSTLAAILEDEDKIAEAEPLRREAASMYRNAYGPPSPQAILGDLYVGRLLMIKGSFSDAATVTSDALQRAKSKLRTEDPRTIGIGVYLSRARAGEGRTAEAQKILNEAHDWATHSRKVDNIMMANISAAQAGLSYIQNNYGVAMLQCREAISLLEQARDKSDDSVLGIKTRVASTLIDLGHAQEAESLLVSIIRQSPRRVETIKALIRLYDSMGKADRSIVYRHLLADCREPSLMRPPMKIDPSERN